MFKSMTIYQLTQPSVDVLARLEKALESKKNRFAHCKEHDQKSRGFVSPLGPDSKVMQYSTEGGTLFCVRTDEKLLPSGAVKEQVNAIVAEREKGKDAQPLSKTDRNLIRDEVIEQMLPGMVATPAWTYAYLDSTLGMLFVGASEDGADAFVDFVKGPIEGVPFQTLGVGKTDPCDNLTTWLYDAGENLPDTLQIGDACSLKHGKEGGCAILNISHEDLEAEDIHALLDAGKICCRLGLEHERLNFAVTGKNSNIALRKLSLTDASKSAIDEHDEGVPEDNRAHEFAAWLLGVREVMAELATLFGGWPTQEMLDLGREDAS